MGNLLVLSYAQGRLYRLTLTDGAETGRTMLAMGLGSADGLALDAAGNIYVTDQGGSRRLIRLSPPGQTPKTSSGLPSPANIEFGYGALSCTDIYVATGGGPPLRGRDDRRPRRPLAQLRSAPPPTRSSRERPQCPT